jgi:hypothetical protein
VHSATPARLQAGENNFRHLGQYLITVNAIKGISKTEYTNLVTIRMGICVKSNNPVIYITKKMHYDAYE